MKASPSAMPPRKRSMTAAVQAGKAPICSGATTCCATPSPSALISAQDASYAAYTVGDDLDRLLGRHVTEHRPVLLVEGDAQLLQMRGRERRRGRGHRDLVALAGIAHVERALDANAVRRETVIAQLGE